MKCSSCIHCEVIHSIKPLVYCRFFGECNKEPKAIDCKEYVDRKLLNHERTPAPNPLLYLALE
jgi:hypothetical protein